MKFYEKMDLLMKVANISNSQLGRAISFDPSYISRIRTGKRELPRNRSFLQEVTNFFVRNLGEPYQHKALADLLCPGQSWPEEEKKAGELLMSWLTRADEETNFTEEVRPGPAAPSGVEEPGKARFFCGNPGKREAVARFLTELTEMDRPPRLLLYSNESFEWMYEDREFARRWGMLLTQYLKKGGRITIVHTISRGTGDMLVALQKWIPVYLSGAVQPWYYPKLMDRVFRNTMFIAEGFSAITASSVGDHAENSLSCLTYDPQAVACLEREYEEFLQLCKPLMQIFSMAKRDRFLEALEGFNAQTENMLIVRTTPSFFTMPKAVARSMTERLDNNWLLKRQEEGEQAFRRLMEEGRTLTEVLNLPGAEELAEGQVAFPLCDLLDRPGLVYTAEEFKAHLNSVIEDLNRYENYRVVLSSAIPKNQIVYVKEDTGVILVKTDFPSVAFAISEQRMVSAFWDYLMELKNEQADRSTVIRRLEELRDAL